MIDRDAIDFDARLFCAVPPALGRDDASSRGALRMPESVECSVRSAYCATAREFFGLTKIGPD